MFEFRPPAVVQADSALAVAFRTGDEHAVRELFARYGGLVHAVALAAAGTPSSESADTASTAADLITLHTFLQAWRNSEAFEPGRSFAPWLASLARTVSAAAACSVSAAAVDELLAERVGWVEPPAELEDRVVAGVIAEAHVDPSEIYTAADVAAAQANSSRRGTTIRSVVLGVVGGLVLVLGGIFVLSATGNSPDRESTTIALRPTGRIADVEGSIEVASSAAGLAITLDASPLPDVGSGGSYLAVVAFDDGTIVPAGSFSGGENPIDLELAAAVPEDRGEQFMIVIASTDSSPNTVDESDVVFRAPLP